MKKLILMALAVATITACEKPILGYGDEDVGDGNVIIHLSPFATEPMTRAANRNLRDAFTKLNVQVFKTGTDEKVYDKIKTQTSDNASFGTLALSLPEGDYNVLCVGHSSARSATLAADKVSFTAQNGRKLTDTFWTMNMIEVRGDNEQVYDWTMDRSSAMFRMVVTDETPENVTQFKFEYSGGSADFNPNTGVGITKSKQTEQRDYSDDSQYDIYTFPRDDSRLQITAYALDASDQIVSQREFVDVPVKARYMTTYRGKFFDGTTGIINGNSLTLSVNDQWEGTYEGEF